MENDKNIKKEIKQKEEEKYKQGNIALLITLIVFILLFFLMLLIKALPKHIIDDKPIIYLYPEEETELSVKLGNPHLITCSYPKYEDKWNVIAHPDGTLIDTKTRKKFIFIILGRKRNSKI